MINVTYPTIDAGAICVVPSHLRDTARLVVRDDGKWICRLDADSIVPTGVTPHPMAAEISIILRMLFEQALCSVKSVYERAFASNPVSMGKQMQGL